MPKKQDFRYATRNISLLLDTSPSATRHCLARATLRTGVRASSLPMNWQIAPMAKATITLNLLQPLDIHLHFAPQVAFDYIIPINHLTQPGNFVFRQVSHPRIWIHLRLDKDILTVSATNAIDVRECDLNAFVSW
jgi:hypothetical protein